MSIAYCDHLLAKGERGEMVSLYREVIILLIDRVNGLTRWGKVAMWAL